MPAVEKISAEIFPRPFGRYVLFKHLGEGAMGRVYMASLGGRVCAIKTLLDENEDPHIVQRFLDEAQLVTRLSHPNLVYVSEVGEAAGWPYVAMEYVQGKTLFEAWRRCAEHGRLIPMGITILVAREILNGLAYMHEKAGLDLVHRDLAPNNVMLSYEGAVKIIDFGLARWAFRTAETAVGFEWGLASYRSPEQLRGTLIDGRSDIYTVGVILWELLTGKTMWTRAADDPPPPPPSQVRDTLPPDLDDIVLKAMATRPADRYGSAREFAAVLTQMLTSDFDSSRLARFLSEIFAEDIVSEAAEEEAARLVGGASVSPASVPPPELIPAKLPEPVQSPSATAVSGPIGTPNERTHRKVALPIAALLILLGLFGAFLAGRTAQSEKNSPPVSASEERTEPAKAPAPAATTPIQAAPPPIEPPGSSPTAGEPTPRNVQPIGAIPPTPHQVPALRRTSQRQTKTNISDEAPSSVEETSTVLLAKAEAEYQRSQFIQARIFAQRALRLQDNAEGHLILGKTLLQMRRLPEAAEQYRKVLAASPGNAAAQAGLQRATSGGGGEN